MDLFNRFFAFMNSALEDEPDATGNRAVSFARLISLVLVLYFLATDAWFFHRKGVLVDNTTMMTQLGVMTAFYASNKFSTQLGNK